MTGEATATPEMVTNLGELEVLELTKDGVKPLAQNPAAPSAPASIDGAGKETEGSPPDATPETAAPVPVAPAGEPPAPAAQPAQQVVEPAPKPVVEVIPPAAPVSAPAAPAPVAETPVASPAEEAKTSLEKMDEAFTKVREEAEESARRAAQSAQDKHNAQVTRQLEESKEHADALTKQMRDLQSRELTEDERVKVQKTWAQEDERTELDAYKNTLVDMHRTVFTDSLLLDYKDFGITRTALDKVETPEEMELYCEQQKSAFLEKKLSDGQAPAQPAATAAVTPPPVAPAAPVVPVTAPAATPVPVQPKPNAGVPAGASAPSDIGTSGVTEDGKKFSEESNTQAMRDNLKNMDWNTVRVRQA